MKSPIKYYGGKSYMTDIILSHFPEDYEIYVEGFGGGASVLFAKQQSGIEIYNDLGKNVYSLFKVLSDRDLFIRLKEKMDVTLYSAEMREEYKNALQKSDLSLEDRAYFFLCVNRMSFNGVGGFSTTHIVRRNMSESTSDFLSMIDRLPLIHNRLSSVIIENRDIFDLIDKYDRANAFLYLDPPYVRSTRLSSQSYEVEMSDEQHKRLVERLNECKCKVLLSGYDCKLYSDGLADSFEKISFPSPNAGSKATETLWKNY